MSPLSNSIADLRENQKQWEAFCAEGHCVVLAPPGSGKTKLLTTRMAYDLLNRIPNPHGAACITLTNAAANELRRRVDRLGVPNRSTLFVGTVHSFALQNIILPFAILLNRPELRNPILADKVQKNTHMNAAIREVFGRSGDTRFVGSTVDVNRQRLATDEEWSLSGDKIREVALRYEGKLRSHGLIDFQDLVTIAVQFVENHIIVRKVLAARYTNIYVDEYQDLPPGLDRLVRALCFDYRMGAELFAVGDPDQAILSFMGTRPELLDDLASRPAVRSIKLEHNYRCRREIIRVANLLWRTPRRVTGDEDGGSVTATFCEGGFIRQCEQVAMEVREAADQNVPLHEIVVICPTNAQCSQVAEVLRYHSIPVLVRSDEYRPTNVTSLIESLAAWSVLGRERSGYRLGALLARCRTALGPKWTRQIDFALTGLLLTQAEDSAKLASTFISDVLDSGLRSSLLRPAMVDDANEVHRMTHAFESGPMRAETVRDLAERARIDNRVEATTMASSKGLEFDVVYILGAEEKQVPHFSSYNDAEKMAEDRRRMYVSITRARCEVKIFYSGYVEWPRGSKTHAGPSRFLSDMGLI